MKKKGNEYIDPLEKLHEAADPSLNKNTKSKKESKKAESADKEEAKNTVSQKRSGGLNVLKPVTNLFARENRRTNLTTGALLVLFSIYQFLSFVSYFFTWKADQNLILNKGLFGFIFSTDEI